MSFYTKDALHEAAKANGWLIGDHTYGAPGVQTWGNDGGLTIGKYCSIAGNVKIILGGNHRVDFVTTYPFNSIRSDASHISGHPISRGSVTIGNDVWLAQGCVILSGVTIGDGAVVGGEAVVARNVPPYAVVVGNPARIVRYRFSEMEIQKLLEARWWDWGEEEISSSYELLQSSDLTQFLDYCRKRRGENSDVPKISSVPLIKGSYTCPVEELPEEEESIVYDRPRSFAKLWRDLQKAVGISVDRARRQAGG